MTVSAHDVAAVLRERLPGLPLKKLHKLLYYCQAHHLAAFERPLFAETIAAFDMGPVVTALLEQERQAEVPPPRLLGEAELNTIGYVLSRYGKLSGTDLEHLTHLEDPWKDAYRGRRRKAATIRTEDIRRYFQAAAARFDDEERALLPDPRQIDQWLAGSVPPTGRGPVDTIEAIKARLASLA